MNCKLASRRRLFFLILSFSLTSLVACSSSKQREANLKRYHLTGRVIAIDKANKSLTVDGDEIPGFMSAMQMPYDVKDASLLDKLAPGDKITADIVVSGEDSWLENIKVTGPAGKSTSTAHSARLGDTA